jgi:hypothetical protein
MEFRIMTGYSGASKTKADLLAWSHWQMLDPEFALRTMDLLEASWMDGQPLGIGTIDRTNEQQDALFYSRHFQVSSGGCCTVNGKHYQLRPGQAHAAPSGKSYHEPTTPPKKALAIDFTGNLAYLKNNGAKYGIHEFSGVNKEPWHGQPIGIPNSRSQYVASVHHPLSPWARPAKPPVQKPLTINAPIPTMSITKKDGNDVVQVRSLQHILNFLSFRDAYNRDLVVDGDYGVKTSQAVMAMQLFFQKNFVKNTVVDGVYGPKTAELLQNFLNGLAAMAA